MSLMTTIKRNPHAYGEGWEEFLITLFRDGAVEAKLRIYSTRQSRSESPKRPWHLISVGNFATPEAAATHLREQWDREPTEDELFDEAMAESRERAMFAHACGYVN